MQIKLTAPAEATYKTLTISSDNTPFITKGTASMANGIITAEETCDSIVLSFGEGLALNVGEILTTNMLVAPVDLSTSELLFKLTDNYGKTSRFKTRGKLMNQGKAYLYSPIDDTPYITFNSDLPTVFYYIPYYLDLNGNQDEIEMNSNLELDIEFSLNGGEWGASWEVFPEGDIKFGGEFGNLRIRGKNPNGTSIGGSYDGLSYGESHSYYRFSFGNQEAKVTCSGDIRTLIDYENYRIVSTEKAQFRNLFSNCTNLISAPDLPITSLSPYCYQSMFKGCTSLTSAPDLPATSLTTACYQSMFEGCKSIVSAPTMSVSSVARYSCDKMFQGCTSLTSVPSLLATNLYEGCYRSMFANCMSLQYGPSLPSMSLSWYCYEKMFYGCTSLTQAPNLPATTLANYCYRSMFAGCSSLQYFPSLPALTLVEGCYSGMFSSCSKLSTIAMFATDISATDCLNYWVYDVAPLGSFVKNSKATWEVYGINGIPHNWRVYTEEY